VISRKPRYHRHIGGNAARNQDGALHPQHLAEGR